MGSRCFWHEKVCPVEPLWPCVPALQRDELFSSWLIRCSLRHACDAVEFAHWLWPKRRAWTSDIDQNICSLQLDALQMKSGISTGSLMASSLVPLCRHLGLTCPAKGIMPWVLSLGGRYLRRAGGLQYCPLCFAEGVPFYRQQWRMAWCTCCPDHGVMLCDHCPHCLAVLAPHRLTYRMRNLGQCHQCGQNLAETDTQASGIDVLTWERCADAFFHGRPMQWGWPLMSVPEGFVFLREILRLLRVLVSHPHANAERFLAEYGVDVGMVSRSDAGLTLECLPTEIRAAYLAAVGKIVTAGQQRFMATIELARLCPWLREAVSKSEQSYLRHLMPMSSVKPQTEIRASRSRQSKPHSPRSVLKAWLRFQRRAHRAGVLT